MGNPSLNKRQRERSRQEKQREKEAKRQQRKQDRAQRGPTDPEGVDPDIAGIVPGPQPPAED